MLDDGTFGATEEGVWVTHEDMNPATASIDGDLLDPGLSSRLADEQVQTTAVGVSPRFLECPDASRR